ncbi:MAG: class I SAM-dependent methyltransferase [bacterium]|nr:class I SAM-dependent methyltransferase [bacterium]
MTREGRVIDLAREGHYWNHLTEAQMAPLLDQARSSGWNAALDAHYKPRVDAYTYAYATDERRADWFPLCSVPDDPVIVDIGAGWGAVAVGLARRGARIIAMDSNVETLEFIALRAKAEGLGDRVIAVRIDPLEIAVLPLRDGCANLVVMNGVLEWVGPATSGRSPEALQCQVLSGVRRVLAVSGQVYVGIESRYSVENFRGAKDHSGMKFTAVLPRMFASVLTKLAGKGPYRTYTHSYAAWHRIFESCGFGAVKTYAAMPDYRFPNRLIPLDDASVFRSAFSKAGISRKHHFVMKAISYLGLHRDAVGHYSMVVDR